MFKVGIKSKQKNLLYLVLSYLLLMLFFYGFNIVNRMIFA